MSDQTTGQGRGLRPESTGGSVPPAGPPDLPPVASSAGSVDAGPTAPGYAEPASNAPASNAPAPSVGDSGPAQPTAPVPPPGFDHKGRVRRTRVSGVWVGLIAAAIFLILLIIFLAQNPQKVEVHFLGWDGEMSAGLLMLLSAVIGLVLAAVPGSIRIAQLRKALRANAAASGDPKSTAG